MPWGDIVFMMILAGINLVRVAVDGVGGECDTSSTARPEQGSHLPYGAGIESSSMGLATCAAAALRGGQAPGTNLSTLNSQLYTLIPNIWFASRLTGLEEKATNERSAATISCDPSSSDFQGTIRFLWGFPFISCLCELTVA